MDYPCWSLHIDNTETRRVSSPREAIDFLLDTARTSQESAAVWMVSGPSRGLDKVMSWVFGTPREVTPIMAYATRRDGRVSLVVMDAEGTEHSLLDSGGDSEYVEEDVARAALEQVLKLGLVPSGFTWRKVA